MAVVGTSLVEFPSVFKTDRTPIGIGFFLNTEKYRKLPTVVT
jgi:hypothetical protein